MVDVEPCLSLIFIDCAHPQIVDFGSDDVSAIASATVEGCMDFGIAETQDWGEVCEPRMDVGEDLALGDSKGLLVSLPKVKQFFSRSVCDNLR